MKRVFVNILLLLGLSGSLMAQETIYNFNTGVTYSITQKATSTTTQSETVTYSVTLSSSSKDVLDLVKEANGSKLKTITYDATPISYENSDTRLTNFQATSQGDPETTSGSTTEITSESTSFAELCAIAAENSDQVYTFEELQELGVSEVIEGGETYPLVDTGDPDYYKDYAFIMHSEKSGRISVAKYYAIGNIYYRESKNYSVNVEKDYMLVPELPVVSSATVLTLSLPSSVTSIAAGAITALTNLQTLNANSENGIYIDTNNKRFILNADKTELIAILPGTANTTYNLPTTVTKIADDAFVNVSNVFVNCYNTEIEFNGTLTNGNVLNIISAQLSQSYTEDGKGIKVTGTVLSDNLATLSTQLEDGSEARYIDFSTAAVGEDLTITPASNQLYYFSANDCNISGTNVVVDGKCSQYVINDDGTNIYIPTAFTASSATVKRSFTAGKYATLSLPFAVTTVNSYGILDVALRAYILNSYNDDGVNFEYCGSMNANYPYICRIDQTKSELNFNKVEVQPTVEEKVTKDEAVMTATFSKKDYDFFQTQDADTYMFNSKSQICNIGSGNFVNPLRAYIYLPGFSARNQENVKVNFLGDDDNFDAEIYTKIDKINAATTNGMYYSIDGVSHQSAQKGLNIIQKMQEGKVVTSKFIKK